MALKDTDTSIRAGLDENQRELKERYPLVAKACESLLLTVAYKDGVPISQGSSVVVEGNRVVTAYHVIEGADEIFLYTLTKGLNLRASCGRREIPVAPQYPHLDIATFSLPELFESIVPSAETATANILLPEAFIIGFPYLWVQRLSGQVTE